VTHISDIVSSETDKTVHWDSRPLVSGSYWFLSVFTKFAKSFY